MVAEKTAKNFRGLLFSATPCSIVSKINYKNERLCRNKLQINMVLYRQTSGLVITAIDHNQHRVFSNWHYVPVINGDRQHRASVISMAQGDQRVARVDQRDVAVEASSDETITLQVSAENGRSQSAKLHPISFILHCVSKKNIPDIFDCNLKTNYQILIIFGTIIPDTTCH